MKSLYRQIWQYKGFQEPGSDSLLNPGNFAGVFSLSGSIFWFLVLRAPLYVLLLSLSVPAFCQHRSGGVSDDSGEIPVGILCDGKTWMLRNLNDAARGGACHGEDSTDCAVAGRFYTWTEAQSACPVGWHLPSTEEYNTLNVCLGKSDWRDRYTDLWVKNNNSWFARGDNGLWSKPSETDGQEHAYYWYTSVDITKLTRYYIDLSLSFPVRCVKDITGGRLILPASSCVGTIFTVGSSEEASSSTGGITYTWSVNGMSVSGNGSTLSYQAFSVGIYTFVRTAASIADPRQTASASMIVTVYPFFNSGIIASTGETICFGTVPSETIDNIMEASGGDGNISYNWYKNDTLIPGANGATYKPSMPLYANTVFTRKAKDSNCSLEPTLSTGLWKVTVRPEFKPGAIASAGESICAGDIPSKTIASSASASGGTGNISYQWYRDTSAISGAIQPSYRPSAALISNTVFTRRAIDNICTPAGIPASETWIVTAEACPAPGGEQTAVLCDGNIWMVQNLNNASKGGQCYENNASNCTTDGRLYTWTEAQRACPSGWHLPSYDEFVSLESCFNKTSWKPLYGGCWMSNLWSNRGQYGYWWTSGDYNSDRSYSWYIRDSYPGVYRNIYSIDSRLSVRCIKDPK